MIDFSNPQNFEILPVVGYIPGHTRRVVVLACYVPPNYTVGRAASALEYVNELVIEAMRMYKDPYIVITGDFNQ